MKRLNRRRLLASSAALGGGAVLAQIPASSSGAAAGGHEHGGHTAAATGHGGHGKVGDHANFNGARTVDYRRNGFHPTEILRDFDWGTERKGPNGQTIRSWEITARDMVLEVAPGIEMPVWTYGGRIPGPTLRCREDERLEITLINGSAHPHTMHFHGFHRAEMDGVPGLGAGLIEPGGRTTYVFDAQPAGVHLYHCHVRPLAEHIAKGLYGAFIIDPKDDRAPADELVMVMHGLDTNFDRVNELYAVNGIPFAYMNEPIKVKQNQLIRLFLINTTEYDLINSFHLHGTLFDYYPTGTGSKPAEFTDTVMLCQGQRGMLEWRFPYTGKFMFHAHQSEFTELGWQGFFEVSA